MKCVIPESIFTWPRGQVDARSWDAALDVVQQSLLGMAVANDVNDEEDRVLTAVFMECEELRAKKYLEVVTTNHKLAKKYAISPRTVTNWRKEVRACLQRVTSTPKSRSSENTFRPESVQSNSRSFSTA